MTRGTTILDSLSAGARWYPERPALIQGEPDARRSYTYAELLETSQAFGRGLSKLGVDPGDRVAMVNRSTVEHAAAFFGAMWAGAIPATLHFRESDPTICAMVDRIDPAAVVFQPALRATADAIREGCDGVESFVALDHPGHDQFGDTPAYARSLSGVTSPSSASTSSSSASTSGDSVESASPEALPAVVPSDRAFINFSSGTTGVPKPVVHTHENVVECAHLGIFKKQIGPQTRALKTNTPSFVAWANATFPVLAAGATLVYLERSDPREILAAVESESVTSLVLVPTVWKRVLDADPSEYDLGSVQLAGYAGEPLDPALFTAIRDAFTGNVTTMYGTTETMSSSTVLFPADVTDETLDSIGYPAPNTEVRVVEPGSRDPEQEVERGQPGEILIRGPSVSGEIWDDPAQTRETFHEDGWVFTGDLATVGDDGLLYLLGREDNMILSGGINVYPEKVRDVLVSQPNIDDAAVVGVPHPEWGETPKAFVVPTDDGLAVEDVEDLCRNLPELSSYQRPRAVELVDSLPRTGTNKLDYAALDERQ